jgi:hypothetical protein
MGVQATIVDSDIRATNGIIHQIDKVLNTWLVFQIDPLNWLGCTKKQKIICISIFDYFSQINMSIQPFTTINTEICNFSLFSYDKILLL